MATVSRQEIFKGTLNAGETRTLTWNNPAEFVVGVSAAPKKLDDDELFFAQMSFQVVKVESIMDQRNHFRLVVTVKNTGNQGGMCVVNYYFLG